MVEPSRWWPRPAFLAVGSGCPSLGSASAAATAVHTRPSATFVWSGGRDSNPLRLRGRQEFYRMNYRRC